MDEDRIKTALRNGEDAFWAAVSESFPEATSGDLAPDASHALTRAMERAIEAWVDANVNPAEGDAEKELA